MAATATMLTGIHTENAFYRLGALLYPLHRPQSHRRPMEGGKR